MEGLELKRPIGVKIEGCIYSNNDEFPDAFIEFVENKGWNFGGGSYQIDGARNAWKLELSVWSREKLEITSNAHLLLTIMEDKVAKYHIIGPDCEIISLTKLYIYRWILQFL